MTIIHTYKNGKRHATISQTPMGYMVELYEKDKLISKQMSKDEFFCEQLAEEFTDGYNPEFLSE